MSGSPPNFTKSDGVSLREHLESRLIHEHEYFEARIIALEKASTADTQTLNRRLAGMNEFRDAMNDLSNRMATRNEVQARAERVDMDIADLKSSRDEGRGKASQARKKLI